MYTEICSKYFVYLFIFFVIVFSSFVQVPDCLKSKSLEEVELEADERSQSSKQADRGPLARMFPATYGARLLQVRY